MSHDSPTSFSAGQRRVLLQAAAESIRHGLTHERPPPLDLAAQPPELRAVRATFVTVFLRSSLQGCIGTVKAMRPLLEDVSSNAFAAAFHDPRGVLLSHKDLPGLGIGVSVLSVPEPLKFSSEADLLAQIRPGIDGLIVQSHGALGTLLPSVWESLPEPRDFFNHVKMKAGLKADFYSPEMSVKRYTTEYFSDFNEESGAANQRPDAPA